MCVGVLECEERRPGGPCVLQLVSELCDGRRRCLFVGNEDDLLPPCSSGSSDQLITYSVSDRIAVTYACCKNTKRFAYTLKIKG